MEQLSELIQRTAQSGRVAWIGVRPARHEDMDILKSVEVLSDGLSGDHGSSSKRAVTLIQSEHLAAIGNYLGRSPISPELLRRNLVVEGINLLALRNRQVRIGSALLNVEGICAPCSRMERALGAGGYSAVRGHGGVIARVLVPGLVTIGDVVVPTSS